MNLPQDYFETEYGLTFSEADQIAHAIHERAALDVAAGRIIDLPILETQPAAKREDKPPHDPQ